MTRTTRTPSRLLRAAGVLACVLGISAAGHHVSGYGGSVAAAFMAAVALAGPAWTLGKRERGFGSIAGFLLLGQVVAHYSLTLVSGTHSHQHHDADTLLMLGFHLASTLVAGWWLRLGERALWRAARRTVAAIRVLVTDGLPVTGAVVWTPRPSPSGDAVSALLRHVIVLRGPPQVG